MILQKRDVFLIVIHLISKAWEKQRWVFIVITLSNTLDDILKDWQTLQTETETCTVQLHAYLFIIPTLTRMLTHMQALKLKKWERERAVQASVHIRMCVCVCKSDHEREGERCTATQSQVCRKHSHTRAHTRTQEAKGLASSFLIHCKMAQSCCVTGMSSKWDVVSVGCCLSGMLSQWDVVFVAATQWLSSDLKLSQWDGTVSLCYLYIPWNI